MSSENLRELEREVEAARARLTVNLSNLRSPETYSEFADSIKQTALDTKNSLVEDARSRTQSAVDELVDRLKAKAAANPAALLVIGAGVAWHLLRRPPIVAALVGGGLYSLLRTQPDRSHLDDREYLDEARANLQAQARDVARSAGDAGMQAAGLARHKAAELAQTATEAGRQAADAAKQKAAELAGAASDAGREAADVARQKAAELAGAASDAGRQAADMTRQKAAELAGAASDAGRQAADMTRQTAAQLADAASNAGRQAADAVRSSVADWTQGSSGVPLRYPNGYYEGGAFDRGATASNGGLSIDKLLLGAAGVAVAAAVALAYQRRPGEVDRPTAD